MLLPRLKTALECAHEFTTSAPVDDFRGFFAGSGRCLPYIPGAWLFVEAADRECLHRSARLAPAEVLFLDEATSLVVDLGGSSGRIEATVAVRRQASV